MYNKKPQYIQFRVKEATTLLSFIISAMNVSRTRAKAILSGGGVRISRNTVTQFDHPLHPGQLVEISRAKPKQEFRNRYVRIVYEDAHLLVVEKSIGILSMATSANSLCVKSVLDEYFRKGGQRCRAHVVHRLDRDTSGLLVYAKTMEAEAILEENWHDIVTDRRYVALVSGRMELGKGTVSSWLKDNAAYVTYSSPVDNGGKYAVTHYEVIKASDDYSLVQLKLETGRKNQIRVHLKDLGHPVCGDIKYGDGNDPVRRLALHAFRLDFYHPITGELLHFETPAPKSFLSVF